MRLINCLIYLLMSVGCPTAQTLLSGDLIFQSEGQSPMSRAISDATATGTDISFVHVAILEVDSLGNRWVIEASTEEGVRMLPFNDFLAAVPGVTFVVKRLTIDFPVPAAIAKAKSHLGEPYDWWYLPDNGKMYCSELIYESFLDFEGKPVFNAEPMNFRAPDGSMPEFWMRLYGELGEPVPEGIPGTNPNALASDPRLTTIATIPLQ